MRDVKRPNFQRACARFMSRWNVDFLQGLRIDEEGEPAAFGHERDVLENGDKVTGFLFLRAKLLAHTAIAEQKITENGTSGEIADMPF